MNRKNVKKYLEKLENIVENNIEYSDFEVALVLYLRSSLEEFDNISNKQLKEIYKWLNSYNCSSIFDLDKDEIDAILEGED